MILMRWRRLADDRAEASCPPIPPEKALCYHFPELPGGSSTFAIRPMPLKKSRALKKSLATHCGGCVCRPPVFDAARLLFIQIVVALASAANRTPPPPEASPPRRSVLLIVLDSCRKYLRQFLPGQLNALEPFNTHSTPTPR